MGDATGPGRNIARGRVRRFAARAVTALSFGLGACSSDEPPNEAPVIDELAMGDVASSEQGVFVARGTLAFHDADGTVRQVRVLVTPPVRGDPVLQVVDARVDGEYRARALVPLRISMVGGTAVPGISVEYEVFVVDDRGGESRHEKRSVKLESP